LMPNGLFCKNLVPPGKLAPNPKILGRFLTTFRLANIRPLIPRPTKPRQGPGCERYIWVWGLEGAKAGGEHTGRSNGSGWALCRKRFRRFEALPVVAGFVGQAFQPVRFAFLCERGGELWSLAPTGRPRKAVPQGSAPMQLV
jgi:hypothetical protein